MSDYDNGLNSQLRALIGQPVKGLEERIAQIQSWIDSRAQLRDQNLTHLFTSRRRVSDQLHRLRYMESNSKLFLNLKDRRAELERAIMREELDSWSDRKSLEEALQQAHEELMFERTRFQLVDQSGRAHMNS